MKATVNGREYEVASYGVHLQPTINYIMSAAVKVPEVFDRAKEAGKDLEMAINAVLNETVNPKPQLADMAQLFAIVCRLSRQEAEQVEDFFQEPESRGKGRDKKGQRDASPSPV